MSLMTRLSNLFRQTRLNEELDEELHAHIEEALAHGRSRAEVGLAFGGVLQHRERSRDIKLLPWLDGLASDLVFGWRQLRKHRIASAAAILSLALAVGATTVSFRLVDALLLKSLPIAEPGRFFYLVNTFINRDGRPDYRDDFDYPTFRKYRDALAERADLMVVGMTSRPEGSFGPSGAAEKFYRQYVSGNVFGLFGLRAAAGRLLTTEDDRRGAHPTAVLSYDFWTRRFGRDPGILGKTFRYEDLRYEIVGVAPRGFVGTEPGSMADVFIPARMRTAALDSPGWSWFRIWVRPRDGVEPEQVRQRLQALLAAEHRDRARNFPSSTAKSAIDEYLRQSLLLFPAASGASDLGRQYRQPLLILTCLVVLVLLVACANVGNLLAAQAAARAREMALRISIGAGRGRLMQLVLVQSVLLASLASVLGAVFSWWSAPWVVSMLAPPDDPVRLALATDWRIIFFGAVLTLLIAIVFGLAPAVRASSVEPLRALKGGEEQFLRRNSMNWLIAAQTALCVLILFVAGLFVSTLRHLENRPLGFSDRGVLTMEARTGPGKLRPEVWMQVADRLRHTSGVEDAAFAGWGLLTGNRWTSSVSAPNHSAEPRAPYFLDVSPGFFRSMGIHLISGRDFREGDTQALGIVNEAFARRYFDGRNPIGRNVFVQHDKNVLVPLQIVGFVGNAVYDSLREPLQPTVYVPVEAREEGTFIVRTSAPPLALVPLLRRAVHAADSRFRVTGVDTQTALISRQLIRERLLATLSLFFAGIALLLAATGLYGVLNYSVIRQRKTIGLRMALGARPSHVVRRVTSAMFGMVCLGAVAGLAAGVASGRFVETLLFSVRSTDPRSMAVPVVILFAAAGLAAIPPVMRAVRTDPAVTLRSE